MVFYSFIAFYKTIKRHHASSCPLKGRPIVGNKNMRIPSFLGLMLMSLFLCISCAKEAPSSIAGDKPMPPSSAEGLGSDGGSTNSQLDGGSSTVLPGTGAVAGYCRLDDYICNNQCVNGNLDSKHCGGCGMACAPGEICDLGGCTRVTTVLSDGGVACDVDGLTANDGIIVCGNECKSSYWDHDNCGSCGHKCKAREECSRGICYDWFLRGSDPSAPLSCDPETSTLCGDQCVDLDTNTFHCGVCGNACASDEWCLNGVCESRSNGGPVTPVICGAGEVECDKKCTSLDKDPEHCGACNNACAPSKSCENGSCL